MNRKSGLRKIIPFLVVCLLSTVVVRGQAAVANTTALKLRFKPNWMSPDDRMLAGSVGKTFAAATALQLIKEGKIGLDDKIENILAVNHGLHVYRTRKTSRCAS